MQVPSRRLREGECWHVPGAGCVIPKPPFACDLDLETEIAAFDALKPRLAELWSTIFPGDEEHYTSVVVPSLFLRGSPCAAASTSSRPTCWGTTAGCSSCRRHRIRGERDGARHRDPRLLSHCRDRRPGQEQLVGPGVGALLRRQLHLSRRSSAVEQLIRNQQVLGSMPSAGSSPRQGCSGHLCHPANPDAGVDDDRARPGRRTFTGLRSSSRSSGTASTRAETRWTSVTSASRSAGGDPGIRRTAPQPQAVDHLGASTSVTGGMRNDASRSSSTWTPPSAAHEQGSESGIADHARRGLHAAPTSRWSSTPSSRCPAAASL